jgi:predicted short-subunit dehydrogenase-like oxidoreductase (DUF2520 family)
MTKVTIIGAGNVAYHLTKVMKGIANIALVQVYNRSQKAFKNPIYADLDTTTSFKKLKETDLFIIAIPDNHIAELATELPQDKLQVHTSGSMPMDVISSKRKGVFYPLQTFSKAKAVDFSTIPFCLEANNTKDLILLKDLAKILSDKVYEINSEQRKSLHVAAVFVNNFTNHLFYQGEAICKKYNVPFEVLVPLIKETVKKLDELSPKEAQTGPALRNDSKTIAAHLKLLDNKQQELYKLLSQSITETYE